MECFINKMNFGFNYVVIDVHSPYYQFRMCHQSDCTCLLNQYGFFYCYITQLIIWNLIFRIYKGFLEYLYKINLYSI